MPPTLRRVAKNTSGGWSHKSIALLVVRERVPSASAVFLLSATTPSTRSLFPALRREPALCRSLATVPRRPREKGLRSEIPPVPGGGKSAGGIETD